MHMKHGCLRAKYCSADVLVHGALSKGQPVTRCGNGLAILSVTLLVNCIAISESSLVKDYIVREDVWLGVPICIAWTSRELSCGNNHYGVPWVY